jgi:hypothetical protein
MSNQKNYNKITLFAATALIVISSTVGYMIVQPAMAQNVSEKAGQAMQNATGNQTGNQTGNMSGGVMGQIGESLKGIFGGK